MESAAHSRAPNEDLGLTYQVALRAIGTWLDSISTIASIRIVETDKGFLLQWADSDPAGVLTSRMIPFDDVWALDEDKQLRKRSKDELGGFQNVLRAVGYQLDEAGGRAMLLEQVDDSFLLTYVYATYSGGYALVKDFSVLAPEDCLELVNVARQRRRPGKLTKGFLRLLGDR